MYRNVLSCFLLAGCAGFLDLDGLEFEARDGNGGAGGVDGESGGREQAGAREQTGGRRQAGGSGTGAGSAIGGDAGEGPAGGAGYGGGVAGEASGGTTKPGPLSHPGAAAGASGTGEGFTDGGTAGVAGDGESGTPPTGGRTSAGGSGGTPPEGGSGGAPPAGGSGGTPPAGGSPTGGMPPVGLPVYGDFDPPSCDPELECAGDDCCASLLVSGDQYLMGRGTEQCSDCVDGCPIGTDEWCDWDEQPEHPAEINSFYLDKFEVTVGRFRRFVDDYERWHTLGGLPAVGDGAGKNSPGWPDSDRLPATVDELRELLTCKDDPSYDNWTQAAAGNEKLPMNCVDWWLSFAFCSWEGGRLPTEAEWELAAAGGAENRVYPWGNAVPTDLHANFWWGSGSGDFPVKTDVGEFPLGNGRYGHADLAGNLFEWVLDSYNDYRNPPEPCVNCVDVSGFGRVIRGGGWTVEPWFIRSSARLVPAEGGDLYNDNLGFRCARDVPEGE